ncbi:hypothetical protein GLOIN_2v1623849 [Rhizophagus irregularis DAOM 181602=DAOM 197198]|uniref:Uncharacterized protein n=1 Tax=Rhizophagus irregularis (strain DAOM 181602 / DAOM 197198 / MUCL 43194) TaxID=747089 RepID=A0A2P4PWG6_RHIID|nr:hypothetical protein GLOIN_2v1623849 [Rhizophagus irregularis DAOM 181602=DAOM 197198]POG69739.1 hypothetical protein GLOIN_2v1623849 [Rhizophagus irregularis DAOM 181602=DAOM 197198]GET62993.1 hypothetical protein GLOIN_2v1623849 [Rhizophagus irregularis DAOM 181602=DAOM 197198]|eukprot:XP_025176605.1 hypothetical protein GLOIN_2v1623849 [Rhizophagus irregularis DAOM 181602=DAOM 197198]
MIIKIIFLNLLQPFIKIFLFSLHQIQYIKKNSPSFLLTNHGYACSTLVVIFVPIISFLFIFFIWNFLFRSASRTFNIVASLRFPLSY